MAGTVNKVILIGRLGRDPELRYTPSGAAVCSFSLATDDSYNDRDGNKQERTEWHNIVIWSKLGEIAHQYLKKGSQVYIEGALRSREYTDRDNIKRRVTDIVADQMTMLGGKPREGGDDDQSHGGGGYSSAYGSRPTSGPSGPKPSGGSAPTGPKPRNAPPPPPDDFEDDNPF